MVRFVIDNRAVITYDDRNNLEIESQGNNSNTILDKQLLHAVQAKVANTLSNVIVINNGIISIKANINFRNFNVESSIFKNVNFEEDIVFYHCRFLETVDFGKIQFNKQIKFFSETIFEEEVILNDFKAYGIAQKNRNYEGYSVNNENQVIFSNVKFKKSIIKYFGNIYYTLSFFNVIFHQNIDFFNSNHNSTFHQAVTFKNIIFKETISFQTCQFKDNINFENILFNQQAVFDNAIFHQDVSFKNITFKEQEDFSTATFYDKVNFSNTTFEKRANFRNRTFQNDSSFEGNTFKCAADFSFVTFQEMPQFVGTHFEKPQQVYFTGVEYLFSKNTIKEDIEKASQNTDQNEIQREQIYSSQAYRDSFRHIKSILLSQNNSLDALQVNRIELYCKEVELEFKEPKPFSRDWIDRYQLWFYRTLSDHHTDLGRVFSMLIMLVGLFGIFYFIIFFLVSYNPNMGILYIPEKPLQNYKNIIVKSIKNNHFYFAIFNLAIISLFLLWFIELIKLYDKKTIKYISLSISYLMTIFIIVSYPKLLFPPLDFFKGIPSVAFDPLLILGSVYTFMFGIVVYSFSRTARRSSLLSS